MPETIFSKIIRGDHDKTLIYEDDLTIAFLDDHPLTNGHTLIIPKKTIDHIDDCPPELYAAIFKTVHKVSKHLRAKLKPKRIALVVHGFEVPHAHVHIVPIYTDKEIKLANQKRLNPTKKQLDKLSESLVI